MPTLCDSARTPTLDKNIACMRCAKSELDTLYVVSQIISGTNPESEMLMSILEVLESRLGMTHGTIMLLEPGDDALVVEVAKGAPHSISKHIYRRGEGITGKVIETGVAQVIPDISAEPLFLDRIHKRGQFSDSAVSFICVPVSTGNEVVGTLSADLPLKAHIPLDQQARVISIVASMIAYYLKTRRTMYLERLALETENQRLRGELAEVVRPPNIIGNSAALRQVFTRITLLAQSDTTVIIRGASGTGKEQVACAIHYGSARKEKPFIKVNCAALNENLLESELFGHEKGAFTGAISARKGRIEEARGGTLFLDEIGETGPGLQAKLLRVLQERQFERVGSSQTMQADIRLITATNRDLEKAVAAGLFREDLYYRINVFPIHLTPLCERKDDIMPLVNHFIARFSEKLGRSIKRINTEAINMLMMYHWPGNVRELENCIEYAVLCATDGVIYGHTLPPTLQIPQTSDIGAGTGLLNQVRILERDMITDALKRTNGNMSAAARQLDISLRMMRYKIANLGIRYDTLFSNAS